MPNEVPTDAHDSSTPRAGQDPADQDIFDEPSEGDSGQAENFLEKLSEAPALEVDEDSLVKPENS
ncbi:hypothetical protein I6N91_15835 [Arthrobacter sp. MSA 4-2]|uniref:hypothetical protein n=1 Tax=Arthrobacter sp. MSA 4-2 TaxID=2794349 RepID=UPI0018E72128|nr:hypothetical protein [Arthrobacter sp. MSA 4-2]MBJ2122452.1 hypothetical protein [Arthrobacter sp. MSA 4-2]